LVLTKTWFNNYYKNTLPALHHRQHYTAREVEAAVHDGEPVAASLAILWPSEQGIATAEPHYRASLEARPKKPRWQCRDNAPSQLSSMRLRSFAKALSNSGKFQASVKLIYTVAPNCGYVTLNHPLCGGLLVH